MTTPDEESTPSDNTTLTEEQLNTIKKKGMLEIILEIGVNGSRRFSEIDKQLKISRSTLSNRLTEGKEHNLLSHQLEHRNVNAGKDVKVFKLTHNGKTVYSKLVDAALPAFYSKRRKVNKKIAEKEQRVHEQLK